MKWTLTPQQVATWTANWDRHPQRAQAQLAEKLSKIEVKARGGGTQKKSADTWKTDLSYFFSGDAKALAKVLDDDRVSEAVDRHLGLTGAETVRAVHARVRGQVADGPLDVRIPGFEDYGPVPAVAVYLPPLGGGRMGIRVDGEDVRLHPPELDQLVRACTPGTDARSLAIEGGPRSGRSTVLRALAASLDSAGVPWSATPTADAAVLVVDEWERTSPAERLAVKAWHRPGRTTVMARTRDWREPDLPGQSATIQLGPLTTHWIHGYIDRVRDVLQQRWGAPFDTVPLHRWLDEDALATEFAGNFRTLGMVLRAAFDRTWPAAAIDRPGLLLRQVLSRLNPGPERVFLEDFGPDLLAALAQRMVASPLGALPRREIVAEAARIAAQAGARVALDETGVFRPVEALLSAGPFGVRDGVVTCDAPAFLAPAMYRAWEANLAALFTLPDAAHALEAAAARNGDQVLRAGLDLAPEHLVSGLPALTRILRVEAPYRDAQLWTRAFRLCAAWWSHAPKQAGAPPAPATESFDGLSPLLLLAQAAVRHARLLPTPLAPLDPEHDLPPMLLRWLSLHRVATPETQVLADVLAFVAPAAAPMFPAVREVRTGQDWIYTRIPGTNPQTWEIWWRTVLVPLWERHPLADPFIAGTAEGTSALPGIHQGVEAGRSLWSEALERRAAAGDPGVARAAIDAIRFAFTRGGAHAHQTLVSCSRALLRCRRELQGPIFELLESLRPNEWWDDKRWFAPGKSLLALLLEQVLLGEQIEALWLAWATVKADSLPWRAFVRAGIAPSRVADWALGRGAEGLKPVPDEGFAMLGRQPKHRKAPRLAIIEELAATDDAETAIVLLTGSIPFELEYPLRTRIAALGPRELRRQRIEASLVAGGHVRRAFIDRLLPAPDDEELWHQVIASREFLAERLSLVAQWCAGQEGPDRWDLLLEALDHLESEWSREELIENDCTHRRNEKESLQIHGGSWIAGQIARDDLPGPEDRHEVLRRLLGRPTWAPAFARADTEKIWTLGLKILPPEEFRVLLVQDLRSPWGNDSRELKLGALLYGGQFELVESLLPDVELGPAAASVLTGLRFDDPGWPQAKLEELASTRPFRVDGVLDRLAVLALRHAPARAVDWITERLVGAAREDATRWWETLLPTMPASLERSRALRAYFSALSE